MSMRSLFLVPVLAVAIAVSYQGLAVVAKDNDDQDEIVLLKDVPDAVKATILAQILREVDDIEIEEIEREREGGKVVFELEIEVANKEIELEISADGQLLEKHVTREDHDEEEDDDDEDEEDEDEDDDDEDDDDDKDDDEDDNN